MARGGRSSAKLVAAIAFVGILGLGTSLGPLAVMLGAGDADSLPAGLPSSPAAQAGVLTGVARDAKPESAKDVRNAPTELEPRHRLTRPFGEKRERGKFRKPTVPW